MSNLDEKLKSTYTTISKPGAFSGINRSFQQIKDDNVHISKSGFKEFLRSEDAYTLHKDRRVHFLLATAQPIATAHMVNV